MAAGVATMLIGIGAYTSLSETREAYYARSQFADIFASVERAPNSLLAQIRELDGVAQAERGVRDEQRDDGDHDLHGRV